MYVIRHMATRNSGSNAYVRAGKTLGTDAGDTLEIFIPADKCVWEYDSTFTGDGYRITNVEFFDGNSAASPLHTVTGVAHEEWLGYIGKTGRFVAISSN